MFRIPYIVGAVGFSFPRRCRTNIDLHLKDELDLNYASRMQLFPRVLLESVKPMERKLQTILMRD